ncbi:hypothetical protein XELAEV_18036653mg [Xenopus laevis]|uniref:Triacylglycerol lipase n=1 Tax=Xenopus laevis TaxID=8355 RepID=A0A974CAQ4_XENLA|nr:hypothetical protein XELAEV_18036653mg [Xenopus laevis]
MSLDSLFEYILLTEQQASEMNRHLPEGAQVCYDRLGCFSDTYPYTGTLQRPIAKLPWSPEKINVQFMLYTRTNQNSYQGWTQLSLASRTLPQKSGWISPMLLWLMSFTLMLVLLFQILVSFGMSQVIGHLDFFPNGGVHMPGCTQNVEVPDVTVEDVWSGGIDFLTCNHERAVKYYTDSGAGCPRMGHYADTYNGVTSSSQVFYLTTP